jgi:hypothetical protein
MQDQLRPHHILTSLRSSYFESIVDVRFSPGKVSIAECFRIERCTIAHRVLIVVLVWLTSEMSMSCGYD